MKKYILIGDWVYPAYEGDRHYVSAARLCELYGLDRAECVFADITRPKSLLGLPELPKLYPQHSGRYSLEAPWRLWDGDYEKRWYDVKLKNGEVILCWPNAGLMNSLDGSNRIFETSAKIEVRESRQRI